MPRPNPLTPPFYEEFLSKKEAADMLCAERDKTEQTTFGVNYDLATRASLGMRGGIFLSRKVLIVCTLVETLDGRDSSNRR